MRKGWTGRMAAILCDPSQSYADITIPVTIKLANAYLDASYANVPADFSEATFDGYAPVTLYRAQPANIYTFAGPPARPKADIYYNLTGGFGAGGPTWTAGAGVLTSPETIYGYWVEGTGANAGFLLWWLMFVTAVDMEFLAQTLSVQTGFTADVP